MKFQGIIEGSSVGKSRGFAARGSASFQDVLMALIMFQESQFLHLIR
jgi:hypothetical protein